MWVERSQLLDDAKLSPQTLHPEVEYLLGNDYIDIPKNGRLDQLRFVPYAHLKITYSGVDYLEGLARSKQGEQNNPLLSVQGNKNTFVDSSIEGGVEITGKGNSFSRSQIGNPNNQSESKWFWWIMSIVSGVIILLIGAYVLGVGK